MESIIFLGMSLSAWYTIVVVVGMFLVLLFTKLRTDVAFLAAITLLVVGGVLKTKEAFAGLSSSSVVVVGVLFVVVAGLTYTGVLNWIVKHLMGKPKTLSGAIAHLMIPVALLSSVLSNTTVVALFINVVKMWSKKLGIAPSKLLIPLSYASGMGGILTLIGTPPNLIISGLYTDDTGIQLSIFTPFFAGLFCLVVGILSMLAMQKLLPTRKSPMDDGEDSEVTIELLVPNDGPYVGSTISEAYQSAGIDEKSCKVEAIRGFDNEMVHPVTGDEFVMGGDRMLVTGQAKEVHMLCHKLGLKNQFLDGVLKSEQSPKKGKSGLIATFIMIAMVLLSAFNVMPMLTCCLLAAAAMIIFRCCNVNQAMDAINWEILIIFACSVAIGTAIENTGVAQAIANGLLDVCGSNPYVVLTTICLVATFITEFISNTAAAAMFYPIAMSAATALHANPLTFCVALMIAASSSFATPIGSPTHMLVYLPGGYRFGDFSRVGILMNFIILAANVFIVTMLFPF